MSLRLLFKIVAGLAVLAVVAFTGMLAYHSMVKPLNGVFPKILPGHGSANHDETGGDVSKMLDSADMPDVDPGEKAFQKAHELLALGKLQEAREKLISIINVFPSSVSAPLARHIVSQMNLDEILSSSHMEGKQVHVVKRGDTYLGIAAKYHTTIDCIMLLNSMTELRGIQPGDEIVVMPLEFRVLVEPRRKAVSLWAGDRFVCEYPILSMGPVPSGTQRGTIHSKSAEISGKHVLPQSKDFRAAVKGIQMKTPELSIHATDGGRAKSNGSILLKPEDMEEISLLTRVGNEVEIR